MCKIFLYVFCIYINFYIYIKWLKSIYRYCFRENCKKCAKKLSVYFVFILTLTFIVFHQKVYIDIASGKY